MSFCCLTMLAQTQPTLDRTSWAALAIATIAAMYLMVQSRRKKRRDPLETQDQQPFRTSLAQQRAVERQMQDLLVELSEMSRQISAQLDTRAARLESLLQEADEKIARLKQLQSDGAASETTAAPTSSESSPDESDQPDAPPEPVDPRHKAVYDLADQGLNAGAIASQLGTFSGEVELILALRTRHGTGASGNSVGT